jgi:hypothetical protein
MTGSKNMTLKSLTDVLYNGCFIRVVRYVNDKVLYAGLNLESELVTQSNFKVLGLTFDSYRDEFVILVQ